MTISALPFDPLMQQMYDAITSDVDVDFDVYDQPPNDASFPYASMGGYESNLEHSKDKGYFPVEITIDLWSGYQGGKEIDAMLSKIVGAVSEGTYTKNIASGWRLVKAPQLVRVRVEQLYDDTHNTIIRHGVAVFEPIVVQV